MSATTVLVLIFLTFFGFILFVVGIDRHSRRDLTEAEKLAIREMVGKATSCFNAIYQQEMYKFQVCDEDLYRQYEKIKKGSYQFNSLSFVLYDSLMFEERDMLAKMVAKRDGVGKEIFAEFLKQYEQRAVTHS